MKRVGKGCLGCLGTIILLVVLGVVAFMFFGPSSSKSENATSNANNKVEQKIKKAVDDVKEEVKSNFEPKDITDETIRTIKNYGDYMEMYQYIQDDYLKNYEAKMTELGLTDAESKKSFEDTRTQLHNEYDELQKQYGPMNKLPIPEGQELTNTLIAYRDQLRQSLDLAFPTN